MMSASKSNGDRAGTLSGTIRRQIGTQANRRLLVRMPAFSLQQGPLPEQLTLLLDALDQDKNAAIVPENPAKD